MRSTFLAITIALLVGEPALAAVKHPRPKSSPPSFETCEALSVDRAVSVLQGGNSSNPYAQYNAFMKQCLAGQIPLSK
jgi:hypothetical protein